MPTPCNFSMHVAGAAKGGKIDSTVLPTIFCCVHCLFLISINGLVICRLIINIILPTYF